MKLSSQVKNVLCCLMLLTALGVRAAADEFIGPFANWADVQRDYHVVCGKDAGGNIIDNTNGIQAALNDLGTTGHSNTLYFPAGTYHISKTLTLTGRSGIAILGADPATTTIQWMGTQPPATYGAMMAVNGVWFSRYGRITWDGSKVAVTAWHDYWDGNGKQSYFPTHNEHADEVFKNVGYGIRAGQSPQIAGAGGNTGDAEMAVLRCKFLDCSVAGVSIQDPNALDWFLWYCTFDHCALGVTNHPPNGDGAGNFHVYNSVFRASSVADVSIGNTEYFSLRGNYSLGSKQFFKADWQGINSAQMTLQKNTVLDTQNTEVDVSNAGPLMLIDNVFRASAGRTGPQIRVGVGNGQDDTISVGNTYTNTSPISVTSRLRTVSDSVVSRSSLTFGEPVLPGSLPNKQRHIFEVSVGGTGTEIQAAINSAATQYPGQRAVVHIPQGIHSIPNGLTVPAGSDIQLVGDGFAVFNATTLNWTGAAGGTVLTLNSPSRATLRDFLVFSNHADTGIQAYVDDRAEDRVFMEQGDVGGNLTAGLLVNGLSSTKVELHDFYHSDSKGNSVSVIGGGSSSGLVDLYGGCGVNNIGNSYNVAGRGSLMVQDVWYEAHPKGPNFLHLDGSGTFTLQGGHISTVAETAVPVINVDGFVGTVSLIGLAVSSNYGNTGPSQMVIQGTTGAGASILALGNAGADPNWLINNSSTAQVAFLNNKGPNAGGSIQILDDGIRKTDDAFLLRCLAQTRAEYPSAAPLADIPLSASDFRVYRVRSASGEDPAAIPKCNIRIDKTAPVGTPDLVISSVAWTPANPVVGTAATFRCTVTNQGGAATPAGTVLGISWWVDGVQVNWEDTDTASLAPGASRTETATGGPKGVAAWTATAGAHTILAWVDDVNRIPETSEANNQLTAALTVGAAPAIPIGKTIYLKAVSNGLYVCADSSGTSPLIANRSGTGPWEQFLIVDAGGGNVALKALVNNQYVCADLTGTSPLIANRTSFGAWEMFQWIDLGGGQIALQARANGKYVSAVGGTTPLIADHAAVTASEKFVWTVF